MVFQEIIQVLRDIKNHHHHQEDAQREHKSAQVFFDDIPVEYLDVFVDKSLHL